MHLKDRLPKTVVVVKVPLPPCERSCCDDFCLLLHHEKTSVLTYDLGTNTLSLVQVSPQRHVVVPVLKFSVPQGLNP